MPTTAVRRTYSSILLAITPVVLTFAATPASAGEHLTDPAFDFDCDGRRDPVDGDRSQTVEGNDSAGAVSVRHSGDGTVVELTQATPGIAGGPETDDEFGAVYTAFDENRDGCDDLVIGAPDEDLGAQDGAQARDAGMVWIVPGSPEGLRPQQSRGLNLNTAGIPGAVAAFQWFGKSLSGGTNASGEPFLLIGTPGYRVGSNGYGAGAVYHLRGDEFSRVTQDTPGVPGTAEAYDYFGEHLAATDRYIAVAAPGEAIGDRNNAGMAFVFSHRLTGGHLKALTGFHQDSTGVSGAAESGDLFADGLAILNHQAAPGEPIGALVSVGAPGEAIADSGPYAGMAHLVQVSDTGRWKQSRSVHQDTPGVAGRAEFDDGFGSQTVLSTPTATGIATPATTRWAVASREDEEPGTGGDGHDHPQVQVFGATGEPGDTDEALLPDDFGVPLSSVGDLESLNASRDYLYVGLPGTPSQVYGVPWPNILDGQDATVVVYRVTG